MLPVPQIPPIPFPPGIPLPCCHFSVVIPGLDNAIKAANTAIAAALGPISVAVMAQINIANAALDQIQAQLNDILRIPTCSIDGKTLTP
jgi:polysaccharide deacetylase 2 family uncharacterized protein YibQ